MFCPLLLYEKTLSRFETGERDEKREKKIDRNIVEMKVFFCEKELRKKREFFF